MHVVAYAAAFGCLLHISILRTLEVETFMYNLLGSSLLGTIGLTLA